MTEMNCPKCRGRMDSYERNGITVDQCAECRGVFLDRGELERLIDAEQSFGGGAPETRAGPREPTRPYEEYRGGEYRGGHHGGGHEDKYGKRKRRGFLGELFD